MRILLSLAAVLLFAACGNSGEDVPTDAPTATLAGDALVICPQVAGMADPLTSTPMPSCAVGSNLHLPPGIRGHVTLSPQYPSGTAPVTEYLELEGNSGMAATIALPIHWPAPPGTMAAWYTYTNKSWTRLQLADLGGNKLESLVSGRFDAIPPNLIVLAESQ